MWCAGLALSLVAGRLVQLQAMDGPMYRAKAEHERLQTISIPAVRGSITTADGRMLAMTAQVSTVTADPELIPPGKRARVAQALAPVLQVSPATLLNLIEHPSSPQYVVLARNEPMTVGSKVTAMGKPGINVSPAYARAYPNRNLASNLVGFTTTSAAGDLRGQAGVEESYNSLLSGRDGREEVETGTNGQVIPVAMDKVRQQRPGGDVELTILSGLQYAAQQACAAEVRKARADNCTAVVMQPGTGRILALAQYPAYQPSHVTSLTSTIDLPVQAVFPPGSTAKVITASAALEHGQTLMTPYTVPGQIDIHGFTFHDAEPHPTERLTLAGVVAHSSNVGMVQVADSMSEQVQYHYLRAFGLGEPPGLPLPGASGGILPPPAKWWGDQRYTLAFGQGIAVTAVQMASVYATIANGGVRVQPTITAGTAGPGGRMTPPPPPHRQRVITTGTARALIRTLQQVPMLDATYANQPWGEIPGYSVATKTGTAQVWDPKQHCLCRYGSSYIGMAPASHPKVVVAVNVQNPRRGGYYGNLVAGPVFYKIMKFALQALQIPPDHGKRPNVRLIAP
jgi:cell division protein FtsI (penicillin-binding protein 3)